MGSGFEIGPPKHEAIILLDCDTKIKHVHKILETHPSVKVNVKVKFSLFTP
jgi:hypothetical protein